MKAQIGRWGNSLALRIPKHIVEALNLHPNSTVKCQVRGGQLVIEPIQDLPELSLEELLEGVIDSTEEVDWGKPEGREVW